MEQKFARQVLRDINDESIKLDPQETSEAMSIIHKFVKGTLIKVFKKTDSLFREIFTRLYSSGSYPDGLKIEKPDEFDFNVVLEVPMMEATYKVQHSRLFCLFSAHEKMIKSSK